MKKKKKIPSSNSKQIPPPPKKQKSRPRKNITYLFSLFGIIVLTAFIYLPALKNGLTNWDDKTYLLENEYLYQFGWDRIKFFWTNFYFANYHPLTMLTYQIEFHFNELDPWIYHFNNLLLHLFNIIWVYALINYLTKNKLITVIVTALFAVHPMHVESVAWAAERKDVLYTFFFLPALLFYLKYMENNKYNLSYLMLSFFLFVLALLSKSAAVVLPVVFLLMDFYKSRKIEKRLVIEKLPFFILSVVFGILAVKAQNTSNAIADFDTFTFMQRVMFACYGLCVYVFKLFIPINQSNFYPYPFINREGFMANFLEGNLLPDFFFFTPLIVIAALVLVFMTLKKTKKVVFGVAFFVINVALVLQFVSVGNALMAERYTYVSYIGIFLIIGWLVNWLITHTQKSKKAVGKALLIVLIGWGVFLCWKTSQRIPVWKDSGTLWTDFIKKFPEVHHGYVNRGSHWIKYNQYEKALKDFNMSIQLDPTYAKTYTNRGNILSIYNRHEEALKDYTKAIELNSGYFDAYFNRAICYSMKQEFNNAFKDYDKALEIKPDNVKIHMNRAYTYVQVKEFEKAIKDCNVVLAVNPKNGNCYFYRALAYHQKNEFNKAIQDYTNAIQLNTSAPAAYYNRSIAYNSLGNYKQALQDALKAKQLGQAVSENYIEQIKAQI